MATYTVTTTNWNSAVFWSGISEATGGHTLDFSGLGSGYTVNFNETLGEVTISDGATIFVVGDASATGGPYGASLGGGTVFDFFDTILGSQGNDTIDSGTGDENIVAGGGDDVVVDNAGNDTIDTGTGDDTIFVASGADSVLAGDGSDIVYLSDGDGSDTIDGGSGGTDNDTLSLGFTTGATVALSGTGAGTYTDGGATASGTFSDIEAISGTDFADSIDATLDAGGMAIAAGSGDDTVLGGTGNDTISTADGADSIMLGGGSDVVSSGAGVDTVTGIDGDDFVNLGGGDETASATGGNNTLMGGDGADTLTSDAGADQLWGGSGTDSITAGGGDDTVDAGTGADYVDGGDGADQIAGGSGLDTLIGGGGNDTIYGDDADLGTNVGTLATFDFSSISSTGDTGTGAIGQFAIYDNIGTSSDGTVIQAKMTVIDADNPDIDITFNANSFYINATNVADSGSGVTVAFEFFDQATGEPVQLTGAFTFQDIDTLAESVTAQSADVQSVALSASPATNLSAADDGEALSASSDGTSSGAADENHWAQFAYTNQQSLVFTVTSRGVGTNYAFSANDFSSAPTVISATPESQNDSIDGGTGDDLIYGMAGSDTINGGDGSDTINGGADADILNGDADADFFTFEDGHGNDTVTGGETTTTGTDFDTLDFTAVTNGVTVTATADEAGTVVNGADTVSFTEIEGFDLTESADTFNGSGVFGPQTVFGNGGDDTLLTSQGADSVEGGAGNDSIVTGMGDDTLSGGTGDDYLDGQLGANVMTGGDGADTFIAADDHLGDTITGGEGGTDLDLVDFQNWAGGSTGVDATFTGDEAASGTFGTSSWTFTEIEAVSGTDYDDTLDAGASTADQTLLGNDGADLITGGTGADSLDGGADEDTFFVDDGFGADTIVGGEAVTTGTDEDRIDFSGMTVPITVTYSGDEVGTATDGTDTLSFAEIEALTLTSGNDSVDAILDTAGTNIDAGAGDDTIYFGQGASTVLGGDGNDLIDDQDIIKHAGGNLLDGGAGNDTIYSGDGADTIIAGDGDDLIYSENGADSITGGGGDDTFLIEDSFGNDTITGGETTEDGIGDVLYAGLVTSDLTLDLQTVAPLDPEQGTLSDGTDTISFTEIEAFGLGAGNDTLLGSDGGDQVGMGAGNDSADGNAGDDVIWGEAGDDIITGGTGADTLRGGTGNDSVSGGDDADVFEVQDGFGNDTIVGGEGGVDDDTLDLSMVTTDTTVDLTNVDPEQGTVTSGADTIAFSEIENISLGGGRDTVVLGDGGGTDTIGGFDLTDSGDGTSNDQLDLTGLTSDGFTPVTTDDVVVTDDGSGNAVLTFPGGEAITLLGVVPASLGSPAQLAAIGVPMGSSDYIVSGTAAGELIDGTYLGDPDGDRVDNLDHSDSSNNDSIEAGDGADTIDAGAGTDTILGQGGDDVILVNDGFGNDSVVGGETGETAGDTLDLSGVTSDLTLDLTDTNGERGTVTDGTDTLTFTEIETITLGGGRDTLTLANGGGTDTVSGFDLTDSGDGTTNDQLDVTALTDGSGNPVTTEDVTVTDTNGDGTGDAILTFPGGEAITLVGVLPAQVSTPAQLESIGIPATAAGDFIISGTAAADTINTGYAGDPDGDIVDNNDYSDGSNDDSIEAGDGDDSIDAGAGDDTILGQGGDDEIYLDVALDNDSIVGGETGETLGDRINFSTLGDDITITFTGAETGTLTDGTNTTSFEEIERFQMGTGNDSVIGSAGAEHIIGNFGDDTIIAGGGDDTIFSGFDNDSVSGGDGNDSLVTSTGADTVEGGAGDDEIDVGAGDGEQDLVILADGSGNDLISGFEAPTDLGGGAYSGNDLLDVTGLNDLDGNPVNTGDVTVTDTNGDGTGDAILTFPNGEAITLVGVLPAAVSAPAALEAMGIPPFGGDFIVSGTAAGELIDSAYLGDPDGDLIDNSDGVGGIQGDSVLAGDGADTIQSAAGDDTVEAGTGDDEVAAGAGDDSVLGEAGDDSLTGGDGGDTLLGGDGVDTLLGGTGDDSITGGSDEDLIVLEDGFGSDTIAGGETVTTGTDNDTLDASAVTAPLTVTFLGDENGIVTDGTNSALFDEIEALQLTEGGDSVDGTADTLGLTILGGDGGDTIIGGSGDDTLDGEDSADSIFGGLGADSILGGTSSDTLDGGDGDDTIDGGGDADSITGGLGDDSLTGGLGDDTLTVGSGDTATGDDGDDTFFVDAADMDGTPATITGGETGETVGDTLNITGPATITMTGAEDGTVTWLDGSVLTFSEIETINYTPCFTPGTMIKTASGEVDAADIKPGDVVLTRDNGYQTVRWAGSKPLTGLEISANAALQPIRIAAGALGRGMPERDMVVSPQHRVVMSGAAIQLLFGEEEVLVAACHLVGRPGIEQVCPKAGVTYVHFMFDRHELVMSDGTWTESFQPGDLSLAGLDTDQRAELLALFPELAKSSGQEAYGAARMSLKAFQARLLTEA
ncbi:Hint domain-containing protein [Tropicibacter naphthalenivorans]|uniref:Cyclolysin n=1 Tax=Tropicibacter naphthalenivorans TaxID=441103 RepID=A0A0P1GAW3_9RHOB|nr:Hint domain-containing protein [Tropicibacter naphthalenivorans]CUH78600.1 Cyclolysin [Tropicibacter naphthalenivorans]SMC81007.1 Hint domain-containing protein [Tropicibacter naphthalenivorans]